MKETDNQVFRDFIDNFHHGSLLSDKEAKTLAENGVVELLYPSGQHAGNGLLITRSGYVITANHCLISDLKLRTSSNKVFPITAICQQKECVDLALIRAKIPQSSEAMLYKFLPNGFIHKSELPSPIMSLGRQNGTLKIKKGIINTGFSNSVILEKDDGTRNASYKMAHCTMHLEPGDSGSIVVTDKGELTGVVCAAAANNEGILANFYEALTMILTYASNR